ncbi:hypothetical protein GDO81_020844 [Engystomops pustulosus]|uniref:Secreted protein n=1 Tax=Engystomops pustulosus TaxID=76066 RepID=A0AAV6YUJ4_ENGPU|nr:hypothetical protein GDO81_020844 [Engystomops pustulosus]
MAVPPMPVFCFYPRSWLPAALWRLAADVRSPYITAQNVCGRRPRKCADRCQRRSCTGHGGSGRAWIRECAALYYPMIMTICPPSPPLGFILLFSAHFGVPVDDLWPRQ